MSIEREIVNKLQSLKEGKSIISSKVGDIIIDTRTNKEGIVKKVGQSGNYVLLYADFGRGLRRINPMGEDYERYTLKLREFSSVKDEETPTKVGELDEDWRDGKFASGELKLYCAKMVKEAERLAFSINMMSEKYPEYASEFKGLKGRIIKKFQ